MNCPSCGGGLLPPPAAGSSIGSTEPGLAANPYSSSPANTTPAASARERSIGRLICFGFLWSAVVYMAGSVLIIALVALSGGKSADATPLAIKVAFAIASVLTLLSPLLVIWLTIKGKLPGTRKG